MITNNKSTRGFLNNILDAFEDNREMMRYIDIINNRFLRETVENIVFDGYKIWNPLAREFKRDASILIENPYYKNIKLDKIDRDGISYTHRTLSARTLIMCGYPIIVNKFGRTSLDLGYYDVDVTIPILKEDGDVWMSITEMEISTVTDFVDSADGNVLVYGLGLGYFPYMCSLKDNVKSITIIERNPKIISIFKEYILPQFVHKDKIVIIEGDMYDYLNKSFTDKYDYIFADVWKDNADGFSHFKKLCKSSADISRFNLWIEDSILMEFIPLMSIYIKNCFTNSLDSFKEHFKNNADALEEILLIDNYFKNRNITTSEELEGILTNKEAIIEILRGDTKN